jgi:hypothetical protein
MRTDVHGCSMCPRGEERFEEFQPETSIGKRSIPGRTMVQYDYRDHDGHLFSCVAPTLEKARQKRDRWLEKCPGCGGRGTIRFWGAFAQTVGCEDCAGTGKRR